MPKVKLLADCAHGRKGEIIETDRVTAGILMVNNMGAEVIENEKPTRINEFAKTVPGAPAEKPKPAYERLVELFENDYVEVFGPAGSGKSRILAHVAIEAKQAGKKVYFLDCERSLPSHIRDALGNSYHKTDFMDLQKVIDDLANIPKGTELICFDSLGFPLLVRAAQMTMRERGDAYFKSYLIRGWLKKHAEDNKGLSLGANQPVSELWEATKDEEEVALVRGIRPPTGGKSIHVAKATLRMVPVERSENRSVFEIRTYECQDMPFDKLLAVFTIDGSGERLEWKV